MPGKVKVDPKQFYIRPTFLLTVQSDVLVFDVSTVKHLYKIA